MIKDFKDLEKFLKLCRKQGVQSIRMGDIEVHLGDMPQPEAIRRSIMPEQIMQNLGAYNPGDVTPETQVPTPNMPSEEDLLFWSSAPGGSNSGAGQ